jgi:hypothetical protein
MMMRKGLIPTNTTEHLPIGILFADKKVSLSPSSRMIVAWCFDLATTRPLASILSV